MAKLEKTELRAKKKKPTRTTLTNRLDKVFSIYIRRRYGVVAKCVTCGKEDHWKKMQAGHFMSRRHWSTRWNEDNVQVQCAKCNIWEQGQQYLFSNYLGEEKSDELFVLSKKTVKFTNEELIEMTNDYQSKVKRLEKEQGNA